MADHYKFCSGSYSDVQKRFFSGFPIPIVDPQPCHKCGVFSVPQQSGSNWVPTTHCEPFKTGRRARAYLPG